MLKMRFMTLAGSLQRPLYLTQQMLREIIFVNILDVRMSLILPRMAS